MDTLKRPTRQYTGQKQVLFNAHPEGHDDFGLKVTVAGRAAMWLIQSGRPEKKKKDALTSVLDRLELATT